MNHNLCFIEELYHQVNNCFFKRYFHKFWNVLRIISIDDDLEMTLEWSQDDLLVHGIIGVIQWWFILYDVVIEYETVPKIVRLEHVFVKT